MVQVVFLTFIMFQQKVPQAQYGQRQSDKRQTTAHVIKLFRLGHLSVHSAALHAFHADAHACLLDLALLFQLAVFEVTTMTELHEMAGLVDLTLEPAEGLLDALALTNFDLDGDGKGCGRGGGGGGCGITELKSSGTNIYCEI